jgi:hypothetical protein
LSSPAQRCQTGSKLRELFLPVAGKSNVVELPFHAVQARSAGVDHCLTGFVFRLKSAQRLPLFVDGDEMAEVHCGNNDKK